MSKSSLDYYNAGLRSGRNGETRPDPKAVSWQAASFLRGWQEGDAEKEQFLQRIEKERATFKVWMNETTDPWPQAAREHERFLQAEMKKILPVSRMIRLSKALKRLQTRWDARQ